MKPGTLIFILIVALLVWVFYNYMNHKSKKAAITGIANGTTTVAPTVTTRPAVAAPKPALTQPTLVIEQEDSASGTITTEIPATIQAVSAIPVTQSTTFLRMV